jgi:pimeloyl-ACP methyl ester carboxylesterase
MMILPLLERGVRHGLRRSGVTTTYLSTPIGRLHVYDAPGTGRGTIVLLHGISATSAPFAPLIARLRKDAARVIAIDLPGHGFSDATRAKLTPELLFDTMTAAIDELARGDQLTIVGNSLGGMVATRYAIARPAAVARLVLLSPGGAETSDTEWQALQASFRITSRREALAFVARVQDRPPLIARLIAHELVGKTKQPAVRDLLETTTPAHAVPVAELQALPMPILLWWGRSERLLPASHLAWWRANLPKHAVVEEPDGIGHCPHLDDPARVAARIRAFR